MQLTRHILVSNNETGWHFYSNSLAKMEMLVSLLAGN